MSRDRTPSLAQALDKVIKWIPAFCMIIDHTESSLDSLIKIDQSILSFEVLPKLFRCGTASRQWAGSLSVPSVSKSCGLQPRCSTARWDTSSVWYIIACWIMCIVWSWIFPLYFGLANISLTSASIEQTCAEKGGITSCPSCRQPLLGRFFFYFSIMILNQQSN